MDPRIQYATTSDGVSIAFFSMGEGMPVIMTPPIPWSHLQMELDDPGYRAWYERHVTTKRVIRYDSRGSGLSEHRLPDSLEGFELDILAVADRLEIEKFALVGISVGGPTAVAVAARHPERVSHLILWCAPCSAEDSRTPQLEALQSLQGKDWQLFTETISHAMIAGWGSSEQARAHAEIMRQAIEPEAVSKSGLFEWGFDVAAILKDVHCPTLVLHRREAMLPPAVAARRLAAGILDAQLVLLEGGALLPWIGDMEAVVAVIDEFLGLSVAPTDVPATATLASPGAGMVTILFTDIEGSTALTQRLGDAGAREVFREHERMTRDALARHGGSEVKTMGDGFMASFGSASRALECAIEMQRAFTAHNVASVTPLNVRVGVNAGEPIAEQEDLFGTAVITAARIAAKAQGGEILVSNVVRELVAGRGFLFNDRGEMALRGFDDPVRVYEMKWREDE